MPPGAVSEPLLADVLTCDAFTGNEISGNRLSCLCLAIRNCTATLKCRRCAEDAQTVAADFAEMLETST